MFKVEIFYAFKEDPDEMLAETGRQLRETLMEYLPRAAFIVVTHMETGIRQVYVDGLSAELSAVQASCCGDPYVC